MDDVVGREIGNVEQPGLNNTEVLVDRLKYPVTNEMRVIINERLLEIEKKHNVTILYACESGSRGWGFASTNSDYDVRFIYVEKPDFFVSIHPGRDVIEEKISDELDICGWSLAKTLGLLWKSNPTIFEWLQSPIVYRSQSWFMNRFRVLAVDYFKPKAGWHHYRSMTFETYRHFLMDNEVTMKKYFYAIRPMLAAKWVQAFNSIPPMRLEDLLPLVDARSIMIEIDCLLKTKASATEKLIIEKNTILNNWITDFLDGPRDPIANDLKKHPSIDNLSALLKGTVKHYA